MELISNTGYPPINELDMYRRLIALKSSASIIRKLDKCNMVKIILVVLGEASLRFIYDVMHRFMRRPITFDEIKSCLGLPHDTDINATIWVLPYDWVEED